MVRCVLAIACRDVFSDAGVCCSHTVGLADALFLKPNRSVAWDSEKELVLHDLQANKLLEREYRAPWEYPKIGRGPWGARFCVVIEARARLVA